MEVVVELSQETKAIIASTTVLGAILLTVLFVQSAWIANIHERINDTNERITRVEARVDARFDKVDARFDKVDARLDRFEAKVEARLNRLEAKLDALLLGRSLPILEPNPEANPDKSSE